MAFRGSIFDNPWLQRPQYPARIRSNDLAEAYLAHRRRQLIQEAKQIKAALHRKEQLRKAERERSYRRLQPRRFQQQQQRRAEMEPFIRHSQQRQSHQQRRQLPGVADQWHRSEYISGYDDVKRLTPGGMSKTVKIVRMRRTGDTRVIKRVDSGRDARLREELEVLKRIPKDCYLNYMVEYAWSPNQSRISFVLEFCNLGDLCDDLGRHMHAKDWYEEGFIWHMLHDLGKALAFCHNGIVSTARGRQLRLRWNAIWHLDIKPANIFLSGTGRTGPYPRIVLGDFGCAVTMGDIISGRASPREHIWGTDEYRPPQSFPEKVGKGNTCIGYHTDIWALGAVAATLCRLSGRPIREQLWTDYASPCGPRYSNGLNELVRLCVRRDHRRRPRAWQVVQKIVSMGRR